MQPGSSAHNTILFAAAEASFITVKSLHPRVEYNSEKNSNSFDPVEISNFIKDWAIKLGAVSVGITKMRDYYYYSVAGRGNAYGQRIEPVHKYGIAITIEMSKDILESAPLGSVVMESAQQYLGSGIIAMQISEFIRELGYSARAHIDGNYRVVCPLVARDAGLGEIGRMGLLMTPELGPRVRIAAVTTDLSLVADKRDYDPTVYDFCTICKKCADVCPAQAIDFGDMRMIDRVNRWQINSEACYTFWCSVGTDCGRCVSVCPYSHPDTLLHNLIRKGIKNSWLFRRIALKLDDLFYGRKPAMKPLSEWLNVHEKTND